MSKEPLPDPADNTQNDLPERPLECSECRRPIKYCYTEVIGNTCSSLGMCAECPELAKRMQGNKYTQQEGLLPEGTADLACGNCGTTLETVKIGSLVGCSNCYEVFDQLIVDELMHAQSLPSKTIPNGKKSQTLHIGRSPGESKELTPSMRILALNEALNETLAREDYEQAAFLRDQIRALSEKKGEPNAQ